MKRNITLKRVPFGQDQKEDDYEFWRKLGDEERFKAAWELVIQAFEIQGRDLNELRFQRSVEKLSRSSG